MTDNSCNDLVKILLVGNSSVGKTCIFLKYSEDQFNPTHLSTIGLDYITRELVMDDGVKKTFQIWDTAGQDRFRSIVKNYFKGAHGILLAYDITSRLSFDALENWAEQIKDNSPSNIKTIIVGNKCDLPERTVKFEEGQALAESKGYPFFETSAKTGHNINEAIQSICQISYNEYKKMQEHEHTVRMKLDAEKKKKALGTGCCGNGNK